MHTYTTFMFVPALSLLSHVFGVPNAEFTKRPMFFFGLCISGTAFCSRFFTHNLQANHFTSGNLG